MNKRTEANLKAAFAGESQARNKYTFFAKVARKEGYHLIADTFEEAAENEKKHAELILRLLGGIGSTKENLQEGINGETYEFTDMYPSFLEVAEEEGEEEAAKYFKYVINAEENHANEYKKMLAELEAGTLLKADENVDWRCRVCGYVHNGTVPPDMCPLCLHPKEHYDKV